MPDQSEIGTYAEKGVITVVSKISSTLSDGLDPSELLCLWGGGNVNADRPASGMVVGLLKKGTPGTDNGLLGGIELPVLLLLLLLLDCFLEKRNKAFI